MVYYCCSVKQHIVIMLCIITGWLIKNVQNFAMMPYCSTIEFKQKETTLLKSNHS